MLRTVSILGLAALLSLWTVRPALADVPGFAFGLGLQSHHVLDEEDDLDDDNDDDDFNSEGIVDDTGFGGIAWIGSGLTQSFALRVALSVSGHGIDEEDFDADLLWGGLTLDGMYLFMDPEALRPYLMGGIGAYRAMSTDDDPFDFEVNGFGFNAGLGLLYFFNDSFAMDLAVRGEFINWEDSTATLDLGDGVELKSTGTIDDTSTAINLQAGFSIWP